MTFKTLVTSDFGYSIFFLFQDYTLTEPLVFLYQLEIGIGTVTT